MTAKKNWTVLNLLNTTTAYFEEKQIENPRLNAEQLLGRVTQMERVNLYVSFERLVTPVELDRFRSLVKRRALREPLQYILGDTEFKGLPFRVNPSVLIPRPETEVLVETILERKSIYTGERPVIVDVGSGSGCIAVSLAKLWPETQVFGLDISREALETAKQNAEDNGLDDSLQFLQHDIFSDWPETLPQQIDILVSNPPYIAAAEIDSLQAEVRSFEPHIALTDEEDGLRFYRRLFELAAGNQTPHCQRLFLEMSGSQSEAIIQLAKKYPFTEIKITNDLARIPRVMEVKI